MNPNRFCRIRGYIPEFLEAYRSEEKYMEAWERRKEVVKYAFAAYEAWGEWKARFDKLNPNYWEEVMEMPANWEMCPGCKGDAMACNGMHPRAWEDGLEFCTLNGWESFIHNEDWEEWDSAENGRRYAIMIGPEWVYNPQYEIWWNNKYPFSESLQLIFIRIVTRIEVKLERWHHHFTRWLAKWKSYRLVYNSQNAKWEKRPIWKLLLNKKDYRNV